MGKQVANHVAQQHQLVAPVSMHLHKHKLQTRLDIAAYRWSCRLLALCPKDVLNISGTPRRRHVTVPLTTPIAI